jgi:flagellar biosynthetic protein FliQ
MTISHALDWYRQMLWTAVLVGGPVILAGVVIGLIVAVLQAATQINDFAPKAVATILVMVVAGPWMLNQLVEFTRKAFEAIAHLHP